MNSKISIADFVYAISEAVDLMSPLLNYHHKRVAYMSCCIAKEMNLDDEDIRDIFLAAMLHDVGAFNIEEREMCLNWQTCDIDESRHAILGYKLLINFKPLAKAAELIAHHHKNYDPSKKNIPMGSHIIHLADRISVKPDLKLGILPQVPRMHRMISYMAFTYHPEVMAAFERLSERANFWFEAYSDLLEDAMLNSVTFSKQLFDINTLKIFAKVIAQIIDFRSRFTATHSSGVAAVAHELSEISGFSFDECQLMEIAGYLHDLGKLAVSNDILEKNGPLSETELLTVQQHAYYTHYILGKVKGMEQITSWVSHHHERYDGSGYPFHLKKDDCSMFSQVMAVADVITALTEDRPYRLGMDGANALNTLRDIAYHGKLNARIVDLVNENFSRVNQARLDAQKNAQSEYETFYNMSGPDA